MSQSINEKIRLRRERVPRVVVLFPTTLRGLLGFLTAVVAHIAAFAFYATNKALLAAAFIAGLVVGLTEGFFHSTVKPPLVAIGERLSATKAPRSAPLVGADETLPLAPARLFGESYRGSELEQRGTEAHEADDMAGPGPLPELAPPSTVTAAVPAAPAPTEKMEKPTRAEVEEEHAREAEYAAAMAGFAETERVIHAAPPAVVTAPAPAPALAAPIAHPTLDEIKETMTKAKEEEETVLEYVKEEKPEPRPTRPPVVAEALAATAAAAPVASVAVPAKEVPETHFERIKAEEEAEGKFHGAAAALEEMGHKEEAAVHAVPPLPATAVEAVQPPLVAAAAEEEEEVETPKQPSGWGFAAPEHEEAAGETELLMGGTDARRSDHPSPGPSPPRAGEVPRVVAVTLHRRPEVAKAAAATAAKEETKQKEREAAAVQIETEKGGAGYTASQITAAPEILLPEGAVAYEEDKEGSERVPTPAARPVPAPAVKPVVVPPAPVHVGTEGVPSPVSAPVSPTAPIQEPVGEAAGQKKKKKPKHGGRGPIGGPLHKLAKEIKKAVTPP